MDAFMQSLSTEQLKNLHITTIDHVNAVLSTIPMFRQELFTQVMLNKDRDPEFDALVKHFALQVVGKETLERAWILEAISQFGISQGGIAWLVRAGYLEDKGDNLAFYVPKVLTFEMVD